MMVLVTNSISLQLRAIYSVQVFCNNNNFPKGKFKQLCSSAVSLVNTLHCFYIVLNSYEILNYKINFFVLLFLLLNSQGY